MRRRLELVAKARHAGTSCLILSLIPALLVAMSVGLGLRQVGMRSLAIGGALWLGGLVSLGVVLIVASPRSVRAGFWFASALAVTLLGLALLFESPTWAVAGPLVVVGLALSPLHRLASDLERASIRLPRAQVARRAARHTPR